MPPHFTLREAVLADAPGLANVHGVSWREAYTGLISSTIFAERTPKMLTARWERNLTEQAALISAGRPGAKRTLLAEVDGQIVGFAHGGIPRHPDPGDPDVELWGLYVLDRAGRRGVGTALVHAVLGDRDAFLDVLVGNTRAVAFYEKMGFRRVGPVRTVLGLVDDEGRVVGEWRMVRRSSPPASDEVR